MGIIKTMRKQTAVWWPLGGINSGGFDFDIYGQPLYADPIQIDCRWEDLITEVQLSTGANYISKSTVYVDRDVVLGGLLMLGLLTDIIDSENPRNNDGAWEIMKFDNLPGLKAKEFLKTAFL